MKTKLKRIKKYCGECIDKDKIYCNNETRIMNCAPYLQRAYKDLIKIAPEIIKMLENGYGGYSDIGRSAEWLAGYAKAGYEVHKEYLEGKPEKN